jgi:hypothetical protein
MENLIEGNHMEGRDTRIVTIQILETSFTNILLAHDGFCGHGD